MTFQTVKIFAHTFREVFQESGYILRVPPTVIQELTFHALKSGGSDGDRALRALQQMRKWEILPFDLLPAGHAIAEQFFRKLNNKGFLDGEFNDGLILAETSLACIPMLVTSDSDLLVIDEVAQRVQFEDSDLFPVAVAHPRKLLKAMGKT
ncbi:MAG: hypothetical protein ACREFR_19945 [Limisphaerales bacterium]